MKAAEKKKLLAEFIEKNVQCGFSIIEYIGKPLNYFDYGKIKERINWLNEHYQLNV